MEILEQAVCVPTELQFDVTTLRAPAAHESMHAGLEGEVDNHARGRHLLNTVEFASVVVLLELIHEDMEGTHDVLSITIV